MEPIRPSELEDAKASSMDTTRSDDSATAESPPGRAIPPVRPARILIAEDNMVNQKLARLMLEQHGHQVVVVNDGAQALERLEAEPFDLVLMDVQMPVMDGFQVTAAIRGREAGTGRHMPVIAITAGSTKGDRERCLNGGFDDYIPKPVHWPTFMDILERHSRQPAESESVSDTEGLSRTILDLDSALANLNSNREILREITEMFLDDAPGMIQGLAEAIDRGDAKALRLGAHTLKGSVSILGGLAATIVVARLEEIGRTGDLAEAEVALARVRLSLEQIRPALMSLV
ncbi:response regulator, partial [Singulisphaera rosea]